MSGSYPRNIGSVASSRALGRWSEITGHVGETNNYSVVFCTRLIYSVGFTNIRTGKYIAGCDYPLLAFHDNHCKSTIYDPLHPIRQSERMSQRKLLPVSKQLLDIKSLFRVTRSLLSSSHAPWRWHRQNQRADPASDSESNWPGGRSLLCGVVWAAKCGLATFKVMFVVGRRLPLGGPAYLRRQ